MSNTDNTEQLEEMKKAIKDAVKSNLDELVEGNMKKKGYKKDESDEKTKDEDGNPIEEKDENDPCWDGYVQYGMKKKNGKKVPNCVKESELTDEMKQKLQEMKDNGEDMDDMDVDDDEDVDIDINVDDEDDDDKKS